MPEYSLQFADVIQPRVANSGSGGGVQGVHPH